MTLRQLLYGVSTAAFLSAPASAQEINIGVPSWAAAQVITDIMAKVLTTELGVQVNLIPGTNPVIFEAMDTGDLDVHPDVWMPNQQNLVDKYVHERGSVVLSENPYDAGRGVCVTQATIDALGIDDIYDLTDPDIAREFDSDGDGKGEYWVGAAGWASTTIELVRMNSYGVSETFELAQMDEEAGMALIRAAAASGKPFATNCVRPNVMFKIADLVMLEEPAYDSEKWNMVTPTESANWLDEANIEVSWPAISVHVAYATRLGEELPEAADVLSRISFDTSMIEDFIFAMLEEKKAPGDIADAWIEANPDRIRAWLGY